MARIEVAAPRDDKCWSCHGTGRSMQGEGRLDCLRCKGMGWLPSAITVSFIESVTRRTDHTTMLGAREVPFDFAGVPL